MLIFSAKWPPSEDGMLKQGRVHLVKIHVAFVSLVELTLLEILLELGRTRLSALGPLTHRIKLLMHQL